MVIEELVNYSLFPIFIFYFPKNYQENLQKLLVKFYK